MNDRERHRRKDPARTEPVRNWSTIYRPSDSWDAASEKPPSPAPAGQVHNGSPPEGVPYGVEVGYRVVEEHIRQGQAAAQQFNSRAASHEPGRKDAQAAPEDVQQLLQRMFQSFSDLVPLWLELINTVASSRFSPSPLNQSQPGHPQAGATPGDAASAVSVEVVCTRPTRVALQLQAPCDGRHLATHGLRSIDPAKPAIAEVAFVSDPARNGACLRINVPEDQPAGIYTGVVIDTNSGEPRGTLSVRVGE